MNPKVTLVLVILVVLLGGYAYFFELQDNNQSTSGLTGETDPVKVHGTVYGEYDVVGLELSRSADRAYFSRTDERLTRDWAMLQPTVRTPEEIDQVLVNGAATRLARLTASQVITGVTDMVQYGLKSPELTVTLTISNGQEITLFTGAETPVDNKRYIKTAADEQTVYLVTGFAVEALHDLFEPLPP